MQESRVHAPFSLEKVGLRDGSNVYKLGLVFAGVPADYGPWAGYTPKKKVKKVAPPSAKIVRIEFKGLKLEAGVKLTPSLSFDRDGQISKIQFNVVANVDPEDLPEKLRQVAVAIDGAAGELLVVEEIEDQGDMFKGDSKVPAGSGGDPDTVRERVMTDMGDGETEVVLERTESSGMVRAWRGDDEDRKVVGTGTTDEEAIDDLRVSIEHAKEDPAPDPEPDPAPKKTVKRRKAAGF